MEDFYIEDDYTFPVEDSVGSGHWSGLDNVGSDSGTVPPAVVTPDYYADDDTSGSGGHWSGLPNVGGDGAVYSDVNQGGGALSDIFKYVTSPDAQQLFKLVMGGLTAYDALKRWKSGPQGYKTPAELMSMIPGGAASARTWAPGTFAQPGQTRAFQFSNPQKAGEQLERTYASSMRNPIVPGRRYAEGGDVMMEDPSMMAEGPMEAEEPMEMEGPLSQMLGSPEEPFSGYVGGPGGGQDDSVQAWLSPGEYVWDADVVSALGDGNNEEGARRLDEAREAIRAEKRGAPTTDIPPQAEHPLAYIDGAE